MDKPTETPEMSFKPLAISLPPSQHSMSQPQAIISKFPKSSTVAAKYAAERAALMFGCYRKGDANDPETYTAAIAAILAEYSTEVIKHVTDPRTGLPRTMKFMPNVAEVAEACDRAKSFLAAEKILAERNYFWDETQGKYIQRDRA